MLDSSTFKTVVASTPLVSIDLCLVFEGQLLLGLRRNEPLKGRWFTPGGRLLKNERWQDGLKRIARTELGPNIATEDFELMGVWDHFYDTSAVGEETSTHYVNLPHICCFKSRPDIFLDSQHMFVDWFDICSIIDDEGHQEYMRTYAKWICENSSGGRYL